MSVQEESSNPGCDQAGSSPVWNFQGPTRGTTDSPRCTCSTEPADFASVAVGNGSAACAAPKTGSRIVTSRPARNISGSPNTGEPTKAGPVLLETTCGRFA